MDDMKFSPIEASEDITEKYKRYLKTIFHQVMWLFLQDVIQSHINLLQRLFTQMCHLSCLGKSANSNLTWSQLVQISFSHN